VGILPAGDELMRRHSAFTLIELLIVVAIIAILAAIAVPNFLEAQMRAKISRCHSDMRAIATALESYRVDNTNYQPSTYHPGTGFAFTLGERMRPLTTPISYITSVPFDPLNRGDDNMCVNDPGPYYTVGTCRNIDRGYGNDTLYFQLVGHIDTYAIQCGKEWSSVRWVLFSYGPQMNALDHPLYRGPPYAYNTLVYDATNGTTSKGVIERLGPGHGLVD